MTKYVKASRRKFAHPKSVYFATLKINISQFINPARKKTYDKLSHGDIIGHRSFSTNLLIGGHKFKEYSKKIGYKVEGDNDKVSARKTGYPLQKEPEVRLL